jgi:hypothetical protein
MSAKEILVKVFAQSFDEAESLLHRMLTHEDYADRRYGQNHIILRINIDGKSSEEMEDTYRAKRQKIIEDMKSQINKEIRAMIAPYFLTHKQSLTRFNDKSIPQDVIERAAVEGITVPEDFDTVNKIFYDVIMELTKKNHLCNLLNAIAEVDILKDMEKGIAALHNPFNTFAIISDEDIEGCYPYYLLVRYISI